MFAMSIDEMGSDWAHGPAGRASTSPSGGGRSSPPPRRATLYGERDQAWAREGREQTQRGGSSALAALRALEQEDREEVCSAPAAADLPPMWPLSFLPPASKRLPGWTYPAEPVSRLGVAELLEDSQRAEAAFSAVRRAEAWRAAQASAFLLLQETSRLQARGARGEPLKTHSAGC